MIEHRESRLWKLATPNTCYVVHIDADGAPRHVYWGAGLTIEQASAIASSQPQNDDYGNDPGDEELAIEGSLRFGVPSLLVRYPDGVRGFEWCFAGSEVSGSAELRLHFTDRTRDLAVTLVYRVFADSDVIARSAVLTVGEPVEILRLDSATWNLPHLPDYRVSHVTGGWGREFGLRRDRVTTAETTFTSRHGVTGHHANPWLMIDDGTAGEEHGEVWSAALAWSGSWRLTVSRDESDKAAVSGGFGHDGVTWRLAPGERLETPVFYGLHSPKGFGGSSRAWHQHIRRHILPVPDAVRPVVFNSWEATEFDIDEAGQFDLAEHAARLGAEVFVLDDGWFGRRTDITAGLGDWWANPDRFPRGLGPLIAKVQGLGMKFGLWVEPEGVNEDSDLYRAHPDWVLHQSGRRLLEHRRQLTLNLAREDVAEWTHAWLDKLLTENDIAYLKWDMNRPISDAGWPGHADPERLWTDHVRNVYAIIDRLRADHPALYIEGCAGGGGRADLGMLARVDQFWTSDNTDAAERVAIQHGFGQIYPAVAMGAWVTDSPNNNTARTTPLRYRFHVSMAGALGLGGDLRTWTADETAWATGLVEQYKRIRPIVHNGHQYRLTDPAGGTAAVQYVSPDGTESVVLMFQPSALVRRTARIRLAALDPSARYQDLVGGAVHDGAVLLRHGLPPLPNFDGTSELMHLKRLG